MKTSEALMDYKTFIKSKEIESIEEGVVVNESEVNCNLMPFQRDIVKWAIRKGRAAIFSECGTGKTLMQLSFADAICKATGGAALILCPLSVAEQTRKEARKFGIDARICRRQEEAGPGINITNYEILSHFDSAAFNCVVLDESSILKSFTSSTRNDLIDAFARTPYRLCCSATPAPNDFSELGNTVEFLGIMSRTEMLATYFIHDGSDTSKWRLKGHGVEKFWEFVAHWAVCVRTPADLGYSDEGFNLPALHLIEHVVSSPPTEGYLIPIRAETLSERRAARKESMEKRVAVARELVDQDAAQWLVWCDFNAESGALHAAIDGSTEVLGNDTPDYKADSAVRFSEGDIRVIVSKPSIYGFGMNFQNCHNMIFCGISDSYEQFYQAVRRCWRYGQSEEVNVHIIISEAELNVLDNIKRKQADMETMQSRMVDLMHDVTMSEIQKTTRITEDYKPKQKMEVPAWIA